MRTTILRMLTVECQVVDSEGSAFAGDSVPRPVAGNAAEVKARAVGRKRNTYGKALGDMLLDGGETVDGVVREYLVIAL